MKGRKSNLFIESIIIVFITIITSCGDSTDDSTKENITDTLNPNVSITSPSNESVQTGLFDVSVEATDNVQIEKTELYLNNVLLGFDSDTPYNFSINIDSYESGTYILKAIAFDSSNNSSDDEITIVIAKPSLETPTSFMASKGNYGDKIRLSWNAVPNAELYEVYKLSSSVNEYEIIGTTNDLEFEDNDISLPLNDFYYKVRVHNSVTEFSEFGESDYGYTSGEPYDIIYSFGAEGTKPDEFGFVALISIFEDNLYLSDGANGNIKKYSIDGAFLGLFKNNVQSRAPIFISNKTIFSNDDNLIIEENSIEVFNENTQLNLVGQVSVDNDGVLYFPVNYNPSDGYDHHKVYKFDLNNFQTLGSFGEKGSNTGQLNEPWGVSYFNNTIVVTNQVNITAVFFDTEGNYLKEFDFSDIASILYGSFVKDGFIYIAAGNFVIKTDFDGKIVERIGEGILDTATSVVVDSQNNVIVTEPYYRKIKVLSKKLNLGKNISF